MCSLKISYTVCINDLMFSCVCGVVLVVISGNTKQVKEEYHKKYN